VDKSVRLHHAPESLAAMSQAARWIGRFHAATEACLSTTSVPVLQVYDGAYYLGWVRRTLQFAGDLHHRFPWLATLCARAEEFAALLIETPPCIIHGEFYPKNVLYRDRSIYPVDWESAAIAVGEIDLVSLTDGWSTRIVRQCELEYQRARWPYGAPAAFVQRQAAAQLYMHFRWLGDRPEWTTHKNSFWRFEHLRSAGEQLGLI
jgi:aminoglycoside phosphotransferase (APT) family kinase protein